MTLPVDSPLWLIVGVMSLSWFWKNIGKDVWKYLFEKFKTKEDKLLVSVKREAQFEDGVQALRASVDADRAVIWGFHNGDTWLGNNDSKKKMSLKAEVPKDPTIASISSYYKDAVRNIPIGQVSWWISQTVDGKMRYPDTDKVPHLITRDWYIKNEVKSVLVVPVYNKDKNLTVIVSYEWVGEPVDESKWVAPEGVELGDSDALYNYFMEQNQNLNTYL